MNDYRYQLAVALRAVTIRSPTEYAWLGQLSRPLPRLVREQLSAAECRRHLVASLREVLYASFYTTGIPVPVRWNRAHSVAADPWLMTALSDANAGDGSWESAWFVDRCIDGEVVVSTPRLRVRVPAFDCRAGDGGRIRPGMAVSIPLPKELPALSPGFFMVLGAAQFEGATLRVYWHITAPGAPALVRALSTRLKAETVPFRLKVANHPVRFDRCDAAVLYLPTEAFDVIRETLADIATALTSSLRPRTPAFTFAFAPGVGLAESPSTGESFGQHRCALLAGGIVDAHEQGVAAGSAQIETVIESLAAAGVKIDAPYLEPSLDGVHVL